VSRLSITTELYTDSLADEKFARHTEDFFLNNFYSASALLAMQTSVLARPFLSVRLSVIPSRSGIVSRWMKTRSCSFQRLVGQSF